MSLPRTTARLIVGAVVTALCIGGGVAAVVLPWPGVQRAPLSVSAAPAPAAALLACAGPVLATGRDATDAAAVADAADSDVVAATVDGQSEESARRLAARDVPGGTGPDAIVAVPTGRGAAEVAAAGSSTLADPDLRGFTAAACETPRMVSWLAAGSGQTGASDLVVLANPGDVAASVDLTVFGSQGEQHPAAGTDIVVAPGTQRVLTMAALALGEDAPVIRVDASAAPVTASVQTSITRTLIPGGVDQTGTTADPAATQVIPSFTVAGGASADSDGTTTLRLLAPTDAASATVTVTPTGGGAASTTDVTLVAGQPLGLNLGGLAAGTYTLRVEASASVVAGLWETTGYGATDDFAWYAAAPELGERSLAVVADGPSPVLTLTNDGASDVTVTVTAGAGTDAPVEVTVPAGGAAQVDATAGDAYVLETSASGIRASVTYAGAGALAGYPVAPSDAAAADVVVYLQ
ncbi:DUF5719 family protein [Microbacterium telephonicum]|uniref:Large extracellular alpha-helical protein n=1 Tax=Microbacterium telephonicum TaxID=1714841 RepID=A0A498C5P7_9MICO|nr:DUF5719 family protein [Microbacterium telephonicum]RLK47741.1 hypothetical protein C7474_2338 [Microbacterium telephonicum]